MQENTINGVLNLDTDSKKNRIIHGYNDTKNLLEPIMSIGAKISQDMKIEDKYSHKDKLSIFLKKIKENGHSKATNC